MARLCSGSICGWTETVLAFALVLVAIASLASGLAPALYASSPHLSQVLSGEIAVGGTRKNVRRNALVIVQVAICTLVLVGMGLCQHSLYNLRHADFGFSARNLVADTVYVAAEGYDEVRGKQFSKLCAALFSRFRASNRSRLPWICPCSEDPVSLSSFPVELRPPRSATPL
ncbi:MAG: hypothetical protein ACRD30_06940 [Bryobacteraceae bacterium]